MYCVKRYPGYNVSGFVPQDINSRGNSVEVDKVFLIKL